MRIGIDVSTLLTPRTGIARYLDNMMRAMLRRATHEFHLFAPRPLDLGDLPGAYGLRSVEVRGSRPTALWAQEVLPRWVAEERIDVLWSQNHLVPLRLRRPCARFVTLHDLVSQLYPQTMKLRTRLATGHLLARALRSADRIVAVSHATSRLAQRLLGVRASKIVVISEGIEDAFLRRSSAAQLAAVRAEFNLPSSYVLMVSTVEPRKRHLLTLEALELLPGFPTLVFVGGQGWRCEPIMRRIRQAERSGQAVYLGRVRDDALAALYSGALLSVYPSAYEGFGLPVLEAMSCGCPVVCSWSSSLPEVGGSAVRYFPRDDAAALSRQMAAVAADAGLRSKMMSKGMARAAGFSFAAAAGKLVNEMEDVVCRSIP